jgi:HAD superfamily hydrolase (TIGR01509 family)
MNSLFQGIKLIIFDLDGTLIHSQPLQYETFNTVISNMGYLVSKEEWIKYWIHQSYTVKKWNELKKINLNVNEVLFKKRKLYQELIKKKLELKPGALELIQKLHSKYPLCIASATSLNTIEIIVEKFSIKKYFTELISDKTVPNRKPAPDVFLKVARLMKVNPKQCLVFEDSKAGLQAAQAAGMKCVICPDSFTKTPVSAFKEANLVIDNLNDIIKLI